MGIFCEINLFKSCDGIFIAGSTVRGVIRYAVDKEMTCTQITVSLKGKGKLNLKKKGNNKSKEESYWSSEEYLNVKNVITETGKNTIITIGSYETPFSFQLPYNIPPTFHYSNSTLQYAICCNILYHVCIKFERPGFWKFNKNFKKEIIVESGISPRLPLVPVICGEQKKLRQLFSSKNSIITIKAIVAKSVIAPGEKVQLEYEVTNDTNVAVKAVETKILEVFKFTTTSQTVIQSYDVPQTKSKTGSIKRNESLAMRVDIVGPPDRKSLDFSNIVARDYFVHITVELPFPHFNARLQIPIQVGNTGDRNYLDPPPSYWEAMGEDKQEGKDYEKDDKY
ncbi:unnamed protein product [Parnassius apollo]|uniref:(apollo) hypothetical protein n=1 Tax=Parnassius apollo TaxID=110799 RepID=A0A8S3W105_PARAO|nr:unnamed protein product [Parnassius apollo]